MTAVLSSEFEPYGAPELRRAARPDMVRALLLSSVLVTVAFAVTLALTPFLPSEVPIVVDVPLPPIHASENFRVPAAPSTAIAPVVDPAPARPEVGVPQVVEDRVIEAEPIKTGALPMLPSLPSTGRTEGVTEGPLTVGDFGDKPINQWDEVPFVEQLPVAFQRVTPRYPALALEAGVQGSVVVYQLVGRDGRVKDVKLHPKVHQPLLDDAALEAARAWTFEPALVNGRPVAVWVSVTFRFSQH